MGRWRGAVDLTAKVGAVTLANPVMMASGTAGHGSELAGLVDLAALGAVVVKSVSAQAWAGNPAPRLAPVAAGMLNSIGLENPGIDAWLDDELPALAATGATVVVSLWGFTAQGYEDVASRLATALAEPGRPGVASVVAIEANISCPNVEDRRQMFAHSEAGTAAAISAVVRGLGACPRPVWAKLSPNVTDLPAIAGAAVDAGAGGLTLVNTLMGLAIDPSTGKARLGNGGGGLSGPALHPVAVRAVFDCRSALPTVPIIGVGGISTGEDAAEMLVAGADAVQVGTASFVDPQASSKVTDQLEAWCRRHRITRLADLVGTAHG
jgi:dihydroorotate dehydrogenase (NAD+) catalytic subunit